MTRINPPTNPVAMGIGQALDRAIPLPPADCDERAELHQLRKLSLRDQVRVCR